MKSLSLAICVTALCLALPTGAAAATGTIEGTVTDAVDDEPVANIEVCAYSANTSNLGGCALTDSSGNYVIDGVTAGIYLVEFWAIPSLNYLRQYYDGAARGEDAAFVFVSGSATVGGIDAELQHGGTVSGTVRDAQTHGPLEEAYVCAIEVTTEFSRCASTDPSGAYTVLGLPNGLYAVSFADWESSEGYLRQYYDHKARWAEASLTSLNAGQSRTGVDADLQREARIAGTVTDSEGTPVRWAFVCAQTLFEAYANCEEADSAGRYVLGQLAAGAYKVVFEPEEEGEGRYKTRYFDEKSTFSLADQVFLNEGATVSNINTRLEKIGKKGVTVTTVPTGSGKKASPRKRKPLHKCKKGYRRKLVHGKRRCARIIKPKHHQGR